MDEKLPASVRKLKRQEIVLCPFCHFTISEQAHGWLREELQEQSRTGRLAIQSSLVRCPVCSPPILLKRARLPERMSTYTLENFPGDSQAQRQISLYRDWLLSGQLQKVSRKHLYLYGEPGAGKTSLAVSLAKQLVAKNIAGVFISIIEYFEQIYAAMHKEIEESPEQIFRTLSEMEWLILDDLATENPSADHLRRLLRLIDHRRAKGLPLILTSNLSLDQLANYWLGGLDAIRLVERLLEDCYPVYVKGNLRKIR